MTDLTVQAAASSPAPVLLSLAHASSVQGVVDVEGFWNGASRSCLEKWMNVGEVRIWMVGYGALVSEQHRDVEESEGKRC